jgi:putative Ca2+/H+ antiporter (TMEM165/GDT1 family)
MSLVFTPEIGLDLDSTPTEVVAGKGAPVEPDVWKIVFTTFTTVFFAEMGDKTQLAAIAAVAKTGQPVPVFLAASAALVAVTLLGVAGGSVVTRYVEPEILNKLAGVAFVLIGVLILTGKI